MRWFFGLLAVTCLGGAVPDSAEKMMITYEVKILETRGVDWRAAVHSRLETIPTRGAFAVWSAEKSVVTDLVASTGKVEAAPRVTSYSGATARIFNTSTSHGNNSLVARDSQLTRTGLSASPLSVTPSTSGYSVQITGRQLDQGVLARVQIEDRRVTSVHKVKLSDACKHQGTNCCESECSEIEVPEFAQSEVKGEWLIPSDRVLLISLGAHTVADEQGKAVVRERLVVLDAHEPEQAQSTPGVVATPIKVERIRVHVPEVNIPAPVAPSRHLPQPLDAHGQPVPLPPLPTDPPPSTRGASQEPCATPQTRSVDTPTGETSGEPVPLKPSTLKDRSVDSESNKASYKPETNDESNKEKEAPKPVEKPALKSSWVPALLRPLLFRLPINGSLVIEVRATAKPNFSAPAPPIIPLPKLNAN